MEKLFTRIIGTPIFEDGPRPLTTVKDMVIDPENGKVLALVVSLTRKLIIVPIDIESWHDAVKVHSGDAITEARDVMRVDVVMKSGIHVFRSRVVTKGGKFLGKVYDFSIDSNLMVLHKLYVARGFLGLVKFESRIIPYDNILEILPGKIIVKDDLTEVKAKERVVGVALEEAPVG
ncbi:PRC-barrel domain-containing protein [Candidatus Peregrinibacteria bacterium]|nr:PRC-barrel domain-containing protein [Candidatus Peregrinibacteria bacterium]